MRAKLTLASRSAWVCCWPCGRSSRIIRLPRNSTPNNPVQLRGRRHRHGLGEPALLDSPRREEQDGTVTKWMVEGATPNTLLRRGFTKNSLPVGTEIVVYGYRAKNGANRANGRDVMLPGGKRLFMGRRAPARRRTEKRPPRSRRRHENRCFLRPRPASASPHRRGLQAGARDRVTPSNIDEHPSTAALAITSRSGALPTESAVGPHPS